VNDTYPGPGGLEWQGTLGQIINAVISAGLEVLHVFEHAEPFWRPAGVAAAAMARTAPHFDHGCSHGAAAEGSPARRPIAEACSRVKPGNTSLAS
jgi:hypothetical protein